jgi:hypothetical protein
MSGAAAAAAAAAAKQRAQEEEEKLTPYNTGDLNGYEFKIIRASTRKFKNPEFVRKICAEEAQAGWEMIEKFDDYRIRFKRSTKNRSGDPHLNIDPYRTSVGATEAHIAAIVVGAVLAAALIGLFVALQSR